MLDKALLLQGGDLSWLSVKSALRRDVHQFHPHLVLFVRASRATIASIARIKVKDAIERTDGFSSLLRLPAWGRRPKKQLAFRGSVNQIRLDHDQGDQLFGLGISTYISIRLSIASMSVGSMPSTASSDASSSLSTRASRQTFAIILGLATRLLVDIKNLTGRTHSLVNLLPGSAKAQNLVNQFTTLGAVLNAFDRYSNARSDPSG